MKNKPQRLTEKQEKFCQFYLDTDGNASEAYRMAYDASEMKPNSIWNAASLLLNNPKVTQRIDELRADRRKATDEQRKEIESRLMDIITADPSELFYTDPASGQSVIRQPWQLSKKMRHAVKSVRMNGGNVSYELHGKIDAARLLGAWNGWDTPQQPGMSQCNAFMGELRIGFGDECV